MFGEWKKQQQRNVDYYFFFSLFLLSQHFSLYIWCIFEANNSVSLFPMITASVEIADKQNGKKLYIKKKRETKKLCRTILIRLLGDKFSIWYLTVSSCRNSSIASFILWTLSFFSFTRIQIASELRRFFFFHIKSSPFFFFVFFANGKLFLAVWANDEINTIARSEQRRNHKDERHCFVEPYFVVVVVEIDLELKIEQTFIDRCLPCRSMLSTK